MAPRSWATDSDNDFSTLRDSLEASQAIERATNMLIGITGMVNKPIPRLNLLKHVVSILEVKQHRVIWDKRIALVSEELYAALSLHLDTDLADNYRVAVKDHWQRLLTAKMDDMFWCLVGKEQILLQIPGLSMVYCSSPASWQIKSYKDPWDQRLVVSGDKIFIQSPQYANKPRVPYETLTEAVDAWIKSMDVPIIS